MSTRSTAINLFSPLDNLELTIRRRSRSDLTLLNNSEMATEGPGDLPVPNLRTMEELCQPSLNGQGGPIASISIQAMNFGLKNDMIQQVQDSCQFYGLPGGTFMKRHPEECYDLIENMTAHHNDWDTSANGVNQQVKAVTPNCETCDGPHSFSDCLATVGNIQNVYTAGAYHGNSYQPQGNHNLLSYRSDNYLGPPGSRNLPGNTITNPKEDLKGITTQRGTAYPGHTIPTTSSSSVVERETEMTKDKPVAPPVSTPRPNQRPSIPYPSRLQDQKLRDKANDQRENFFQIFKDLNFNISFADALILMPKIGPSIKSLLTNKDKLCELARTPLNEHFLAVLLKKLIEKLGDTDKFLNPCDFPEMAECLALADFGASINLMPLSVWNKLSFPDLSPTCMTLELTNRSISHPVGVAEDVFVKVGAFHFPANFVVLDFDADPRVPLVLERYFLKTERALIDVFEGELTLRVGKEAITFNLDQTSRYSANYNVMTANRIDLIDMACEEYSQEVLSFFDVVAKVDAFLALEDDPTLLEVVQTYVDTERDILLLEAFLNDDPSLDPPSQRNYLPEDLPPHLEYAFLEGDDKLPVIIAKDLSVEGKIALITVLKSHKRAIAWKLFDIKERLAVNQYYWFLDGFSGYFQIPIDLKDQEKTTFTCPYRTFAYRCMPFGLCNTPGTFQRCMMAIFHDRIEKTMEVFIETS
nr:reverse transcriptase domain-containing protein [Tanacetum cinerariifolium]